MAKPLPSQETLRHLFNYDPDSGLMTWKNPKANCLKPGDPVGCTDSHGYRVAMINNVMYKVHRLVVMYVLGIDPGDAVIDHIDGSPENNRIDNLRITDHQGNHWNRRKCNGYSKNPNNTYRATITVNDKNIALGTYQTKQEARQAYLIAKETYHTIETK